MTPLYQHDPLYREIIWAIYAAALEQTILNLLPTWAVKQQVKHVK